MGLTPRAMDQAAVEWNGGARGGVAGPSGNGHSSMKPRKFKAGTFGECHCSSCHAWFFRSYIGGFEHVKFACEGRSDSR